MILAQGSGGWLCLDMPGGDTSNGNGLWVWECNGQQSQQWWFDEWQIMYAADNSKCVDVQAGDLSAGEALMIWDCNGSPAQQWVMMAT